METGVPTGTSDFWNRLSYRRWLTLEESVRLGRGVSGEFNFAPDEQRIFSEGVETLFRGVDGATLSSLHDKRNRRGMRERARRASDCNGRGTRRRSTASPASASSTTTTC